MTNHQTHKIVGLLCFLGAGLMELSSMSGPCSAQENPAQNLTELVRQLPTNTSATPPNAALVQALINGGDQALPLLEKELRLGIAFKDLNRLLQNGESHRYAVVCVLAAINSPRSTELLVTSLADTPDNLAMQYTMLRALAGRTLSADQIIKMLGSYTPAVVFAGLTHAAKTIPTPALQDAIARLFNKERAAAQFHNEYGAATANADVLWEVRLAAGRALSKDMLPEMRSQATGILGRLKAEALRPSKPDTPVFMSYASQPEIVILDSIGKLAALGQPIRDLVEVEAKAATGDYAKVLDLALTRLGDRSKLTQVAAYLALPNSSTLRFCAASTLRAVPDLSVIPALRKALADPYCRQDGSCLQVGDGTIYPVRMVAADALISLGEDAKLVRELMKQK